MSTCFPFTLLLYLSHSLFRSLFTHISAIYKRLGQFDYGQPTCTTDHIYTCIHKDYDWIYIGEVKVGTDDTPDGIGILVKWDESILEGYWEDGQLHGRGRYIYDGGYYTGEFKEGSYNGEGMKYRKGNKYIGQWVNDEEGQGEINYKDGTKYTGKWDRERYWKLKRKEPRTKKLKN